MKANISGGIGLLCESVRWVEQLYPFDIATWTDRPDAELEAGECG